MQTISAEELESRTESILEQVARGENLLVTMEGRPVADLVPHWEGSGRWLTRPEVIDIVTNHAADPGLRADLDRIAGDTTDDLSPIR